MVPYPYGWGMKKDGSMTPDFTEPFKLAELLMERGVTLLNISMGCNHATHLQLPYNHYSYYPTEHQLTALSFYHGLAATFKKQFKTASVMTGTLSWARQFSANVAAGGIESGMYDFAGFGRMAMAYPDFANDIMRYGELIEKKCCIACNKCINMIGLAASTGCPAGCPVRDSEVYLPIYKKYVGNSERKMSQMAVELFNLSPVPPKGN
jgi:2,4-dienoyl-CoA reductase-like NADH-dependent reductase (Old Yellow Enzyme family)